jgi:hypothetical protein
MVKLLFSVDSNDLIAGDDACGMSGAGPEEVANPRPL